MSLICKNYLCRYNVVPLTRRCSASVQRNAVDEDEYTPIPQYPQVKKPESAEFTKLNNWYKKIKRLQTVEEKMFEVNVQRNWGWKCFMVHEGVIPFNNLAFAQHMTKTHIIKTKNFPDYFDSSLKECSALAKQIKSYVTEAIEYQLHVRHNKLLDLSNREREKEITKIVVNELNRVITNSLRNEKEHINFLQTDYTPRLEASWQIKSLVETVVKKENKYGIPLKELPEEYLDRPSDKFIQYIGKPIAQLRHTNLLNTLIEPREANILNYSVPTFKYDPYVTLGYDMERRHVTNIPGFWPGDDREFSFLSYHDLNHIYHRPETYGPDDTVDAISSQILFASFGWLMPIACYQGFSCYHEVTYPIVTQTVLTDGRNFVFGVYQLNTTETYHENFFQNLTCNMCWITPMYPLYEEYKNEKLIGFNEETLCMLLQLYANEPNCTIDFELKPYLGKNIKYVADYEDDEKREWLEKKFKHVSANKPPARPELMYEVQDWERIFKIQFRMRPQDARRRPFELRQNPYHTKMSEVDRGIYIKRAFRPDRNLPKWRQRKYTKTFYPE